MAEVFLAEATREGGFVQTCVIKVLHPQLADDTDFTRMLAEEAKLVARLRHNNIASLYDVGRHDGKMFLVMEHVDGQDLHAVLAQAARDERRLPVPFAIHVAKQMCTGLHFAHTRRGPNGAPLNLVHRDISPPNVLISTVGEVKIIDFGVAKFNSTAREKTRAGVIKGKFGYMSPEQAWDDDLDHRSDLFSVGICLYEMLTGRSLYGQSEDVLTMVRRAREADIAPVQTLRDGVSNRLAQVVHKILETNRDARFQSAHAIERQLTMLIADEAPDYTNLDAAAFVDELFDTREPALALRSPRITHEKKEEKTNLLPHPARKRKPVNADDTIEERTRPIADVPDEIRNSGAVAHLDPSDVDRVDDDPGSMATSELEFSPDIDDFSEEKTELFSEHRISGSGPLPLSPDNGDDRRAPGDENSYHHPPRREADDWRNSKGPEQPPQIAAPPGRQAEGADLGDDLRTTGPAQRAHRGLEPRKNNAVLATGPAGVIDAEPRKQKKHKSTADIGEIGNPSNSEDNEEQLKRYLQLGGAVGFVVLAIVFVLIQVNC